MQMCAVRPAGVSCGADHGARIDTLTAAHRNLREVTVQRFVTVAMVNNHHVAVAAVVPAGISYGTAVRSIDRGAFTSGNVNPEVVAGKVKP